MRFLSRLFGRSAKKKAEVQLSETLEKKPASEPKRTGTTLRKHEGIELNALEIEEKKDWKVKTLCVMEKTKRTPNRMM